MNKKAAITKELNAKHVKILEGLLKLPENRECADCKNKAPRWASINLGIFICLQCSGIHRSLGVHISKVRSATLDTWLPEQVAFVQEMGNEKSNAYWEAELPLNYNRSRFENFIRAKYVERMWVPRDEKVKSVPSSEEELASRPSSRSGSSISITDSATNQHTETKECPLVEKQASSTEEPASAQSFKSKSITDFSTNQHIERKDCLIAGMPVVDPVNLQVHKDSAEDQTTKVAPDHGPGPKKDLEKTKPAVLKDESSKVDYATELYRMLCVDDSAESDSSPSSDMSSWVDFDTDEEETIQEKDVQRSSASKVHPEPKIEVITTSSMVPETKGFPHKHQKDATDDNQGHPKEPNTAMASSIHLEQLSMPGRGGSFPTNATGVSYCGFQTSLHSIDQQQANGSQASSLNGQRGINHAPGTQLPMLSIPPTKYAGNTAPYTTSSLYRPAVPLNGMFTTPARKPPAALPVSGYDYDFSFLTQGMFTKQ